MEKEIIFKDMLSNIDIILIFIYIYIYKLIKFGMTNATIENEILNIRLKVQLCKK